MRKPAYVIAILLVTSLLINIPCASASNTLGSIETEAFQMHESNHAIDNFSNRSLSDGYIRFIQKNPQINNLSLDEYIATYYGNNINNVTLFNSVLGEHIAKNPTRYVVENIVCTVDNSFTTASSSNNEVSPASSSLPTQWYHNTGTSLPKAVSYDKYDLVGLAKRGDLIYERAGGFGVTGHIAVVEGVYWDYNEGQYYVRLVEAISCGVSRSIVEDTRFENQQASLLSVNTTTSIRNSAVQFCIEELGKPYFVSDGKSTVNITWYCSELAWAAYYMESGYAICLDNTPLLNNMVFPVEIYENSNTSTVLTY